MKDPARLPLAFMLWGERREAYMLRLAQRDMPSVMALKYPYQPQSEGGEEDGEGGKDSGKDEDLTRKPCVALVAPSRRELSPQVAEGECVRWGVSRWSDKKFDFERIFYKAEKRIVAFSFRLLLRKIHLPPRGRLVNKITCLRVASNRCMAGRPI